MSIRPRNSQSRKCAIEAGYRSALEYEFAQIYPELAYEPESVTYYVMETRKYTPDFVAKDGTWYELKGRFTASDRKKMIAVRREYPFQRIVFVFQAPNNRLTKAPSSKTYAEWAESNGFEWVSMKEASLGGLLNDYIQE